MVNLADDLAVVTVSNPRCEGIRDGNNDFG